MGEINCEACGNMFERGYQDNGVYWTDANFCSDNCRAHRKSEVGRLSTEMLTQMTGSGTNQYGAATHALMFDELKKREPARVPAAAPVTVPPAVQKADDNLRYCYECAEKSDSIKEFRVINWFIFLLVIVVGKGMDYRACPKCMRKKIAERAAIQIVTAHVVFPIVAIFHIVQFCRTFVPGHSR